MNWWPFGKKKPVEHRFIVGHKEFNCLIRGGQLTFVNKDVMVHLLLQDIGFLQMNILIGQARKATNGFPSGLDWVKESVVVEQ